MHPLILLSWADITKLKSVRILDAVYDCPLIEMYFTGINPQVRSKILSNVFLERVKDIIFKSWFNVENYWPTIEPGSLGPRLARKQQIKNGTIFKKILKSVTHVVAAISC